MCDGVSNEELWVQNLPSFCIMPQAAVYVGFTRGAQHISNFFVQWHHWRSPQSRPPNAAAVKQTFSHSLCKHQKIVTMCAFTLALECWLLGKKEKKRGILLLSYYTQHSTPKGNQRQMARKNNKWWRRESRKRFFFRLEIKKGSYIYICQKRAWDWENVFVCVLRST